MAFWAAGGTATLRRLRLRATVFCVLLALTVTLIAATMFSLAHVVGPASEGPAGTWRASLSVNATALHAVLRAQREADGLVQGLSHLELHDTGAASRFSWLTLRPVVVLRVDYESSVFKTVWVFAIDMLVLALGWWTTAFAVYSSIDPITSWGLILWGHLSACGGLLAFLGFLLDMTAVVVWSKAYLVSEVAGLVTGLTYSLVLPAWVVSLGMALVQHGRSMSGAGGNPAEVRRREREKQLAAVDRAI